MGRWYIYLHSDKAQVETIHHLPLDSYQIGLYLKTNLNSSYFTILFFLRFYCTCLYLKVWLCDRSSILSCQVVLCQKRIKEQHEKDKRIYANMFQKFAERDSKVKDCFLQQPAEGGKGVFFFYETVLEDIKADLFFFLSHS